MRFVEFLASLKAGLVSPRLRGRLNEDGVNYSAETFDNFSLDKVGTAYRRMGLQLPLRQGSVPPEVPYYDDATTEGNGFSSGTESIHILDFDGLGEVAITYNSQGKIRAYYVNDEAKQVDIRFWGGDKEGEVALNMNAWGGRAYAGPFEINPRIMEAIKLTPKTYLLMRADESINDSVLQNGFENKYRGVSLGPLTITCVTITGGNYEPGRNGENVLIVLPWFVNIRNFLAGINDENPRIPILPINYPFNAPNSAPLLTINSKEATGQTGTVPVAKELTKLSDKREWILNFSSNFFFFDGSSSVDLVADLIGKFIIIPSTDLSYDTVFMIYNTSPDNEPDRFAFRAIMIVGGAPVQNTSQWRLSTWSGRSNGFPRVATHGFSRTFMANTNGAGSQYWVAGIHPQRVSDLQCMMGFSLRQDISTGTAVTDVSKMEYGTISTGDPDRFGFTDLAPILADIQGMKARRRMHILTEKGECQIQYEGTFSASRFTQIKVRTNSCTNRGMVGQLTSEGDGKIFYISTEGIRAISTEDADYESVDESITTSLEGLGLEFTKIQWYEEGEQLIALTLDRLTGARRVFAITYHEDTSIKAVTEWVFPVEVIDFSVGRNAIFLAIRFDRASRSAWCKMTDLDFYPETLRRIVPFNDNIQIYPHRKFKSWKKWDGQTINIHADFYQILVASEDSERAGYLLRPYLRDLLELIIRNLRTISTTINYMVKLRGSETWTRYTTPMLELLDIPIVMNFVPFNPDECEVIYVWLNKYTSKIISQPIQAGGGSSSPIGSVHRIDRVMIQVESSGPFKFGGSTYGEEPTLYPMERQSFDILKTRYCVGDMPQSSDYEVFVHVETDDITPLNISGISLRGQSYQGGGE